MGTQQIQYSNSGEPQKGQNSSMLSSTNHCDLNDNNNGSSHNSHSPNIASSQPPVTGSQFKIIGGPYAALRTQIVLQRVQSKMVERPMPEKATQPLPPSVAQHHQAVDEKMIQTERFQNRDQSNFQRDQQSMEHRYKEQLRPTFETERHLTLLDHPTVQNRSRFTTDQPIETFGAAASTLEQVPGYTNIRPKPLPYKYNSRETHSFLPQTNSVSGVTSQFFLTPDAGLFSSVTKVPTITPAPVSYIHPFLVKTSAQPLTQMNFNRGSATQSPAGSFVSDTNSLEPSDISQRPPPPYPGNRIQVTIGTNKPLPMHTFLIDTVNPDFDRLSLSSVSSHTTEYRNFSGTNLTDNAASTTTHLNNEYANPAPFYRMQNEVVKSTYSTGIRLPPRSPPSYISDDCQSSDSDAMLREARNRTTRSVYETERVETDDDEIPSEPYDTVITQRGNQQVSFSLFTQRELLESPKPERRKNNNMAGRDVTGGETTLIKHFSNAAYRFYMEQHVENVLKSYQQRINRRMQLEKELSQVNLPQSVQDQIRKMLYQKESNYLRLKRAKMDQSMFEKIRTLGSGAFGKVDLVRKRDTGVLYALKILYKKDVLKRNQVAHVKAERDILSEADNEWVVKLYYSFQDDTKLYIVMDYIPGGDMMGLLIKFGIFEEDLAQFYIAELVLAIESVHRMGFIHRDIKPDNILIDKDGHIKLTDFGLCTGFRWTHNSKYYHSGNHPRQNSMLGEYEDSASNNTEGAEGSEVHEVKLERNQQRQRSFAHSLVGTPNYIAPEVLCKSGYTRCCDWWSVGVILYEMRVGQPPFHANTPVETQQKVIDWPMTLHIPHEACLTRETADLIHRLCCESSNRLGANGADEVKLHPYFAGVSFPTLRHHNAPYKPPIRHATDTSNFDPPSDLPSSDVGLSDSLNSLIREGAAAGRFEGGNHAFLEFTFRRFFDDDGRAVTTRMHDPETNAPIYV